MTTSTLLLSLLVGLVAVYASIKIVAHVWFSHKLAYMRRVMTESTDYNEE